MIYHLQVGNKKFVPTEEDLLKVVDEFSKATPVFTVPVKIVEIPHNPFSPVPERLVIHAGSSDWDPTETEINALRKMFQEANRDNGVVATRFNVKVTTTTHTQETGDESAN